MDKISKQLYKKVKKMDAAVTLYRLVGLVVFYIGLKMFSGGMKSMGNMDHLSFFIHNPYWMFLGGIVMTLLWQSSSLSTTVGHHCTCCESGAVPLPSAVASSRCKHWNNGNYLASLTFLMVCKGDTLRIAMAHTGVNLFMEMKLLFQDPIARFLSRIT